MSTKILCDKQFQYLLGNTLFVGDTPGHASAFDSSLLTFYRASQLGFLHGAALCESQKTSIDDYLSTALPLLTTFISDSLRTAAERVQKQQYTESQARLKNHRVALEHIVRFGDESGMHRPLAEGASQALKRGITAGHDEDEFDAVFEIFRTERGTGTPE